jgi:hypothetical protein
MSYNSYASCIAGSYQDVAGAGSCIFFVPGSASSVRASQSISHCRMSTAGTCSSKSGAAGCSDCPLGSSSQLGSSVCTLCGSGHVFVLAPIRDLGNVRRMPSRNVLRPRLQHMRAVPRGTLLRRRGSPVHAVPLRHVQHRDRRRHSRRDLRPVQPGPVRPVQPGPVRPVRGAPCAPCAGPRAPRAPRAARAATPRPKDPLLPPQRGGRLHQCNTTALGAGECLACSLAGTYSSWQGGTACRACEPGTYAVGGWTACARCAPGPHSPGAQGACAPCAAGKASPAWAAAAPAACADCPAGRHSPAGAAAGADCGGGAYAGEASGACTPCPAGRFSEGGRASGAEACAECAAGRYAPAGAPRCRLQRLRKRGLRPRARPVRVRRVPRGVLLRRRRRNRRRRVRAVRVQRARRPARGVELRAVRERHPPQHDREHGRERPGGSVPCGPGQFLAGAIESRPCAAGPVATPIGYAEDARWVLPPGCAAAGPGAWARRRARLLGLQRRGLLRLRRRLRLPRRCVRPDGAAAWALLRAVIGRGSTPVKKSVRLRLQKNFPGIVPQPLARVLTMV